MTTAPLNPTVVLALSLHALALEEEAVLALPALEAVVVLVLALVPELPLLVELVLWLDEFAALDPLPLLERKLPISWQGDCVCTIQTTLPSIVELPLQFGCT